MPAAALRACWLLGDAMRARAVSVFGPATLRVLSLMWPAAIGTAARLWLRSVVGASSLEVTVSSALLEMSRLGAGVSTAGSSMRRSLAAGVPVRGAAAPRG